MDIPESIDQRYNSLKLIGQGGMASVYSAWDTSLERKVAIKVISSEVSANPAFITRFKREIKTLAGLQHPNIMPIYDSGIHEGNLYYVMALIEGSTVMESVAKKEIPLDLFKKTALSLLSALDYAHTHGIIHRDIKPENIFLTTTGNAILADFGIAQNQSSEETKLTTDGSFIGTIAYAAPEQIDGQPLNARSDIYSLGAVLYFILNGAPPFKGTLSQIITAQQTGRIPAFNRSHAVLARYPEVESLITGMLNRDSGARPSDAATLLAQFETVFSQTANGSAINNDRQEKSAPAKAETRERKAAAIPRLKFNNKQKKIAGGAGILLAVILVILLIPSTPIAVHSLMKPLVKEISGSPALSNDLGYTPPPGQTCYGVENLLDGSNEWSFQPKQQYGGWFILKFFHKGKYEISIINGFNWNQTEFGDLYFLNNRITKVKVDYGDYLEKSEEVSLEDNNRTFQSLGKYKSEIIRVTVTGIVPGSRWQDTVISEIQVKEY